MKNKKIFFPFLGLLLFTTLPAFANNCCPEREEGKTVATVQPIETLTPASVASLSSAPDAVVLNPGFGNAYLHPAEMLIGRVPGVWVAGGYNFYRIRIRGALGPPLLVIDNMPFYNYNDEALNNLLWSIPVADIERIEVLKSIAEASLYSQAGNGVIRVVTRRGVAEEE
ncbi:MAG: TonB-dependent receptor plug domain-containing protein [Lewinellaceae bacterium]|nr:TonB-dependent receptor plug domain-containing protein [Phaeodactylibacter sp.]MCB9039937.1 TonB-dependent receptor plug domain-containing protein [Lewinellaceae bacterium]